MIIVSWKANIGFENFQGEYVFNHIEYVAEAVKEITKDKRNFDKVEINIKVEDPKNA